MRARARPLVRLLPCALLLAFISAGGCASAKPNPSFAVSTDDAQRALGEMRTHPKRLERPLVILSGFCDPGIASSHLRSEFKRLTGDDRVIGVSFLFCGDFESCRRQVIEAVDKAFPSDDPNWTTEVDVVGVSMGGLVGRYAAVPTLKEPEGRRLRVARLFTISTPHRGARLAALPGWDPMHLAMRPGSPFLRRLERLEATPGGRGYEVYPYVRVGDWVVGQGNAAPVGLAPLWLPNLPLQDAHFMAFVDPRILGDIAHRLRDEAPFVAGPAGRKSNAAPLPGPGVPGRGSNGASDPPPARLQTLSAFLKVQ